MFKKIYLILLIVLSLIPTLLLSQTIHVYYGYAYMHFPIDCDVFVPIIMYSS